MIGENRLLVTDELIKYENNRLKFKTSKNLPIVLKEFGEYASS